jgi:hypothetical protein
LHQPFHHQGIQGAFASPILEATGHHDKYVHELLLEEEGEKIKEISTSLRDF